MTTQIEIVTEAREWIGTRWQHQAYLKGVATDCIGLVAGVAVANGLKEASEFLASKKYRAYGRSSDPATLFEACATFMDEIPISQMTLADIPLMSDTLGRPQHFGIISCVEPLYIVHAYLGARRVVENSLSGIWRDKLIRCYRLRGVIA